MRWIPSWAWPVPNGVEYILSFINDKQVLFHLHLGEFVDHFQILFMYAENFALPVAEVGVWDGAKPCCLLLGSCYNFLSELRIDGVWLGALRLITLEEPGIIRKDIGTSMADEIVDVLSVDLFV